MIIRSRATWQLAVAFFACVACTPTSAQQTGTRSIAPARFLGKSFGVCAKRLGRSVAVKNPNVDYGAFSRSPNKSVACIVLSTDNDAAVECVTYQFPKGKYTGVSACALFSVKAKMRKTRDKGLHVVSDTFAAEWEKATPNGSHPKHDWLTFFAL